MKNKNVNNMIKKYEDFINEIRFREVDDDGNDIHIEDRKENKRTYLYHPKTRDELFMNIKEIVSSPGFDGDLNIIDTSGVDDMSAIFKTFQYTTRKKIDISEWDVSGVRSMENMFAMYRNFNCDLSKWNPCSVETMSGMFFGCENFNSDLSNWDVSQVEYMDEMFFHCKNFNSDLSKWDVSMVCNMTGMFSGCHEFNSDISGWNVDNVESFNDMFFECYELDIPMWYRNRYDKEI